MPEFPAPNTEEYWDHSNRLLQGDSRSQENGSLKVLRVYVCPNCDSYFGSSGMPKLEKVPNLDLKGQVTFHRNRCPVCGTPRVERFARLIDEDEVKVARRTATATVVVRSTMTVKQPDAQAA